MATGGPGGGDEEDVEQQLRNLILSNLRARASNPEPARDQRITRGGPAPRGPNYRRPQEEAAGSPGYPSNFQGQNRSHLSSNYSQQPSLNPQTDYSGRVGHLQPPNAPTSSPLNQAHDGFSPAGVEFGEDNARRSSLPNTNARAANDPNSFAYGQSSPIDGQRISHRPALSLNTPNAESPRPPPRSRKLYQPHQNPPSAVAFIAQCKYLDKVAELEIPNIQMSFDEFTQKDNFRAMLEHGFQQAVTNYGHPGFQILSLQGFGSFTTGFATKDSDIDLAIVLDTDVKLPMERRIQLEHDLPRLLEKTLLDADFGARLLTRTRVPIIKVCQLPTKELLAALREERGKWDALPEDEQYPSAARKGEEDEGAQDVNHDDTEWKWEGNKAPPSEFIKSGNAKLDASSQPHKATKSPNLEVEPREQRQVSSSTDSKPKSPSKSPSKAKPFLRERPAGRLDFPKTGVGIQADINFTNPLALFNTQLLRCYSMCDPRVQPMVLFVKAWSKQRKINSSYNGTLSSYGYVLMVLHFLIHVANPPVLPNLQLMQASNPEGPWNSELQWRRPEDTRIVEGWEVRFWHDEKHINHLAQQGRLGQNKEPLGVLLRNFFHYYATQGPSVISRGFSWAQNVISIRMPTGLLSKQEKGWTGLKTTITHGREIKHRYLFAVEDPFELDHNVARTVTHTGIVAIRDEFRRAWRILVAVGNAAFPLEEGFFDPMIETVPDESNDQRANTPKE
ncbi:hypothetical protein NA57DRAFT_57779 [Rhizodiscina lignyota]|uniref:polynucleotide adenylyltransferase n=1 Tax=Rhizodiscina lignyota TaxID=1504668 RepID=A0A9P4M4U3_9PEZI|nr:hypothetical protein NA57DRAFT_57779 [Rhizodiscina lignyota]